MSSSVLFYFFQAVYFFSLTPCSVSFLCLHCWCFLQAEARSDERNVWSCCWCAQQYCGGLWKCDDGRWPLLRSLPLVPPGWQVNTESNTSGQEWEIQRPKRPVLAIAIRNLGYREAAVHFSTCRTSFLRVKVPGTWVGNAALLCVECTPKWWGHLH